MKTAAGILALALVLLPMPAALAEEQADKASPAPPCGEPEAAQFDFWLGEWDVEARGRLVGRNVISRIQGGCTLLEEYSAAGGAYEGRSFNYFDPADGRWHQVWVDSGGTRLHLSGGYAGGKMTMSGDRRTPDGTVTDRISWTDNPDGTVRQVWENSSDGGVTWQTLFDGLYRHPAAGSGEESD